MGDEDVQTLRQIVDDLWSELIGNIPTREMLNALDEEFMDVGPDDPIVGMTMNYIVNFGNLHHATGQL